MSVEEKQNNFVAVSILWGIAIAAVFGALVVLGFRIFYGWAVPLANNAGADFSALPFGLFAFAAIAGLVVNLGPCSLGMLPAYLALFLSRGTGDETPRSGSGAVLSGVKLGAIASVGIFGFYLLLAGILLVFGSFLAQYAVWLKMVITIFIFVVGLSLWFGKSFGTGFFTPVQKFAAARAQKNNVTAPMFFGVLYGAGGLSCFFPLFFPLIYLPLTSGGSIGQSLITFMVFAAGQAVFLITVTVLVVLGREKLLLRLSRFGKPQFLQKFAGAILVLTSFFLIGIFLVMGM